MPRGNAIRLRAGEDRFDEKAAWEEVLSTIRADRDGQPIIGAGIIVTGTGNGTVTDAEGRYEIAGISPHLYERNRIMTCAISTLMNIVRG